MINQGKIHWRLKEVMEVRSMKGVDLAEQTGITPAYISRLRGRSEPPSLIRAETLAALCSALDCGTEDLMPFESGDKSKGYVIIR